MTIFSASHGEITLMGFPVLKSGELFFNFRKKVTRLPCHFFYHFELGQTVTPPMYENILRWFSIGTRLPKTQSTRQSRASSQRYPPQ